MNTEYTGLDLGPMKLCLIDLGRLGISTFTVGLLTSPARDCNLPERTRTGQGSTAIAV